jgi:hypothetical protein
VKGPEAGRAARQRLAPGHACVLAYLSQPQPLHLAEGDDTLSLGFEAQAAVRLFFAADPHLPDSLFHGVSPGGRQHDEGERERNHQGETGAD